MTFLKTQIANQGARLRRCERAAEDALGRARRPYRQWAVYVKDNLRSSKAMVFRRDVYIAELERQAAAATTDSGSAKSLRHVLGRIALFPRDIPVLITFEEGGAQLNFITPLDT